MRAALLAIAILVPAAAPAGIFDAAEPNVSAGNEALSRGDAAEALAHFEKAIEAHPDAGEAWYDKGLALHALGRHEEAAEAFGQALARRGDARLGAKDYTNLGNALAAMDRVDDAMRSYRSALEIDPDDEVARQNLEVLLRRKQEGQRQDEGGQEDGADRSRRDEQGSGAQREKGREGSEQEEEGASHQEDGSSEQDPSQLGDSEEDPARQQEGQGASEEEPSRQEEGQGASEEEHSRQQDGQGASEEEPSQQEEGGQGASDPGREDAEEQGERERAGDQTAQGDEPRDARAAGEGEPDGGESDAAAGSRGDAPPSGEDRAVPLRRSDTERILDSLRGSEKSFQLWRSQEKGRRSDAEKDW
ncbi:MAG TPA: tetratricopeptide repeat protein [Vulgatibacter sp.]|nr:tetratricopeptide repeat protein [Vulgatibacter sp.]